MFVKLPPQREGLWWAVILVVALAARVTAAFWWQSRIPAGQEFYFGDSDTYWVLSQAVASGQPYQYGSADARIFRMPAYPALLAALHWVAGDESAVIKARLLGAALGTVTVAGVGWLAREVAGHRTAIVAAALAAIYPGAIATSVFVLSEALFCPIMMLQLAAAARLYRLGTIHTSFWSVAVGALAGLGTLTRPSWLLFVPFAIFVEGLICRGPAFWKQAAISLAALVVVLAPWWWRNYREVGHFVPTTLQVGASLYDGLNPQADGSSRMGFVQPIETAEKRHPSLDPAEKFEYRLDRRFQRLAQSWAFENPGHVLRLAAVKFIKMWGVGSTQGAPLHPVVRWIFAAAHLPIVALALVATRRCGWSGWICWMPTLYLTPMHMIFVSSIRYREPAMLPLFVLAALAVTRWRWPD